MTCITGSAGSTTARASSAPPIGRTKVCTASHAESIHATLSAKNSAAAATPARPMTHGLASTCRLARWSGNGTTPLRIAIPVASTVR